jgi:hypothetical protein
MTAPSTVRREFWTGLVGSVCLAIALSALCYALFGL